jgi:hypothetical protein
MKTIPILVVGPYFISSPKNLGHLQQAILATPLTPFWRVSMMEKKI